MTINFFPAGDARIASSRIRVFSLLGNLEKRGVRTYVGGDAPSDIVVVQKRVHAGILDAVVSYKKRGALIVYDCDDLGPALEFWAPTRLLHEMLRLADLIITNTELYRDELIAMVNQSAPVEIVPDAVDYFLSAPEGRVITHPEPIRIIWFGNHSNLRLLLRHLPTLLAVPHCEVIVCTDIRCRALAEESGVRHFEPWALTTFPTLLRSCHLAFLCHDGDDADRAKSNNRMITSIAWGVPVIASRTPEYEKTACMIGTSHGLFSTSEDIQRLVEELRSDENRQRYITRAQPPIWARHAPRVVGTRWWDVLRAVVPAHLKQEMEVTW